jgi:O-antigen/teichoic acid export membrane protein
VTDIIAAILLFVLGPIIAGLVAVSGPDVTSGERWREAKIILIVSWSFGILYTLFWINR